MHLEINKHTSLLESHNISDAVEEKLKERFPEIQIILHVDPSDLVEEQEWHD
jgi:ferrous-iron efflux pump FieF